MTLREQRSDTLRSNFLRRRKLWNNSLQRELLKENLILEKISFLLLQHFQRNLLFSLSFVMIATMSNPIYYCVDTHNRSLRRWKIHFNAFLELTTSAPSHDKWERKNFLRWMNFKRRPSLGFVEILMLLDNVVMVSFFKHCSIFFQHFSV